MFRHTAFDICDSSPRGLRLCSLKLCNPSSRLPRKHVLSSLASSLAVCLPRARLGTSAFCGRRGGQIIAGECGWYITRAALLLRCFSFHRTGKRKVISSLPAPPARKASSFSYAHPSPWTFQTQLVRNRVCGAHLSPQGSEATQCLPFLFISAYFRVGSDIPEDQEFGLVDILFLQECGKLPVLRQGLSPVFS